jgi:hypothetical protein
MLGLGLSLLTGGSLRPYYAVVAAAFKDRVEADGGTVESMSCLKADLKVLNPIKPPAYTGLLNDYSGAAAAYSLRLLDNTYTGNAIKVRRASDNAEQDIAFSNNELDTATLETFASGTDAFVTTWYDQSGNGNDATQTTASGQPKIVSSGSTILTNGNPSMQFDGSDDYFNTTLLPVTDNFLFAGVFDISTHYNYNTIFDNDYSSNDWEYWFYNTGLSAMRTTAASEDFRLDNSNPVSTNTQLLSVIDVTSTNATMYIDSSQVAADTRGTLSTNFSYVNIGGGGGNTTLNGHFSEFIWYNTNESTNRTGIETNINDFYSIY